MDSQLPALGRPHLAHLPPAPGSSPTPRLPILQLQPAWPHLAPGSLRGARATWVTTLSANNCHAPTATGPASCSSPPFLTRPQDRAFVPLHR